MTRTNREVYHIFPHSLNGVRRPRARDMARHHQTGTLCPVTRMSVLRISGRVSSTRGLLDQEAPRLGGFLDKEAPSTKMLPRLEGLLDWEVSTRRSRLIGFDYSTTLKMARLVEKRSSKHGS